MCGNWQAVEWRLYHVAWPDKSIAGRDEKCNRNCCTRAAVPAPSCQICSVYNMRSALKRRCRQVWILQVTPHVASISVTVELPSTMLRYHSFCIMRKKQLYIVVCRLGLAKPHTLLLYDIFPYEPFRSLLQHNITYALTNSLHICFSIKLSNL